MLSGSRIEIVLNFEKRSDLCRVTSGIIRSSDGEVTLSRLVHE